MGGDSDQSPASKDGSVNSEHYLQEVREVSMARRHNFQTISWFYDLWKRELLDLDPPYQRRSVWNQEFKDYFVDTVLLNYPAPALFVYEDIGADGRSVYHVVDGKQRLTTIFEFISEDFPVGQQSAIGNLRDKYFSSLDDGVKRQFWGYQFLVEYIPSDDEKIINGIFDRINRNVAKLTDQELRHAKLSGKFISACESLAEWAFEVLPKNFPRFAQQSKKQMKDVEFVALLLLLLEEGAKGYTQNDLDAAFTERDTSWDDEHLVCSEFREIIALINEFITLVPDQKDIISSRLRNQADFYSLFGAASSLSRNNILASPSDCALRLVEFVKRVDDEDERRADPDLMEYYDAARSASNDKGARETRIKFMEKLLRT